MTNYKSIPEHTRHSILNYVARGLRPGRGLQYIFENDLFAAVAHCDDATLASLRLITTWIYNFAPSGCHGSREKVSAWINGFSANNAWCSDTEEGLVKLGYPHEAALYAEKA